MEEAIAWILVIIAVLVVLPFVIQYVLIGIYWFLAAAGYLYFGAMDTLTSAELLPNAPWVMWMLWGAVIGASLAFWTIAPIYGLRKQRVWIAVWPFILMAVMALVRAAI